MAVTQQLARITATRRAACRQSVAALDELCALGPTPDGDHLDVNRWPVTLKRAWELTALAPPRVGAVAEALRVVAPEAVHAVVPTGQDQVEAVLGSVARDVVGDLAGQLAHQHTVLRDFYEDAARRRLAVVLWWD